MKLLLRYVKLFSSEIRFTENKDCGIKLLNIYPIKREIVIKYYEKDENGGPTRVNNIKCRIYDNRQRSIDYYL